MQSFTSELCLLTRVLQNLPEPMLFLSVPQLSFLSFVAPVPTYFFKNNAGIKCRISKNQWCVCVCWPACISECNPQAFFFFSNQGLHGLNLIKRSWQTISSHQIDCVCVSQSMPMFYWQSHYSFHWVTGAYKRQKNREMCNLCWSEIYQINGCL